MIHLNALNSIALGDSLDVFLKAPECEPDWAFALSLRGSNLVASNYDPIDAV